MTVFDCCMFLNENDLYEIRLNQHWDFVDKFLVVEAGETHTGIKKSYNFDHERFAPYASKIEYRKFDSFAEAMAQYPELLDASAQAERGPLHDKMSWTRNDFQTNYYYMLLQELGAQDDDIVYYSCADEIIKKSAFDQCVQILKDTPKSDDALRPIFMFHYWLYAYKINLLHKHWSVDRSGGLTEFGNFKKRLPATIRNHYICSHNVADAGWHFTFLDNTDGEMVLQKQRSWAHSKDTIPGQKVKFENTTKEEAVARLFADYKLQIVDILPDTHPQYIIDNIEKFQNIIYKAQ